MVKAGLLCGGGMMLFVLLAATGLSPVCALCVPLLGGTLAGYLTGVFERTTPSGEMSKRGALAGLIAGGIALPGNLIASIINAFVLQNPQYQPFHLLLGTPAVEPEIVWGMQVGLACLVGLINILLSAGLGFAGGAIWSSSHRNPMLTPPAMQ